MKFEDISYKGKCDVCGKETDVAPLASAYGAVSWAYCKDCLNKGLEPYGAVVSYISCAGHFPEDINEAYVNDVRRILKEFNITEEQFIKDCEKSNEEMYAYFEQMENDEKETSFEDNTIEISTF